MLKLHYQETVVLGSLNPAILDPGWLMDNGIIPSHEQAQLAVPIGLGVSPVTYFIEKKFKWSCSLEHLVFIAEPDLPPGTPGQIVAKIFEKLIYTPVRAVGNNFHFSLAKDELPTTPFLGLSNWDVENEQAEGKISLISNAVQINYSKTEFIGIKMDFFLEHIMARFNFHRQVSNAEEVVRAGEKSPSDFKRAEEILSGIVKR